MVCCFSPRISRITSIHHFQLAGFGNNIIYLYYYLGLKPFLHVSRVSQVFIDTSRKKRENTEICRDFYLSAATMRLQANPSP